jgi:hypothetical protein
MSGRGHSCCVAGAILVILGRRPPPTRRITVARVPAGTRAVPAVTFVMDALGNPTGGMQQGFRQASNLNVDLRFDLQKLFGLTGGSFEISFSERFGSSLSREDIGNVFTVQQVFGGQTYRLVGVAYQ